MSKFRKAGIVMNGINYSSLLSNSDLFSNQTKSVKEETKYRTND